jgi:hypothetical protein
LEIISPILQDRFKEPIIDYGKSIISTTKICVHIIVELSIRDICEEKERKLEATKKQKMYHNEKVLVA